MSSFSCSFLFFFFLSSFFSFIFFSSVGLTSVIHLIINHTQKLKCNICHDLCFNKYGKNTPSSAKREKIDARTLLRRVDYITPNLSVKFAITVLKFTKIFVYVDLRLLVFYICTFTDFFQNVSPRFEYLN